jgi:hypothetical protein
VGVVSHLTSPHRIEKIIVLNVGQRTDCRFQLGLANVVRSAVPFGGERAASATSEKRSLSGRARRKSASVKTAMAVVSGERRSCRTPNLASWSRC